jgi:hypothetical protein
MPSNSAATAVWLQNFTLDFIWTSPSEKRVFRGAEGAPTHPFTKFSVGVAVSAFHRALSAPSNFVFFVAKSAQFLLYIEFTQINQMIMLSF